MGRSSRATRASLIEAPRGVTCAPNADALRPAAHGTVTPEDAHEITREVITLTTTPEQPADSPASGSLCTWDIPTVGEGTSLTVEATPGRVTAVVGANGSGKSALGYWLQKNGGDAKVERLIAHRRLWFEHASPDLTPASREQLRTDMLRWASTPDSRWRDHAQQGRPGASLYDLLRRQNERNSALADLHDAGQDHVEIEAQIREAPLRQLNRVLAQANLEIRIELVSGDSLEAVHARRGARYPITEMSDGEKSALLLAAEILTKEAGTVQVIDEPERHLHRSISAGLISAALTERPDCHFVLLTHDLELASSLPRDTSTVVVVTDTIWSGQDPVAWDAHAVDLNAQVSETARSAILGGRRNILLVEGTKDSLDLGLYRALFPNYALKAAGGCDEVIRSVSGLRASAEHHWVDARGIVDLDGRTDEEIEALANKGIRALPVCEIESLYYSTPLMAALAEQQAKALEVQAFDLTSTARADALTELGRAGTPERLAKNVTRSVMQRRLIERLGQETDGDLTHTTVSVEVPSPYPALLAEYRAALEAGDLESLTRSFPVRDTGMPGRVASALRFKSVGDMEAAARSLVARAPEPAQQLRNIIGPIPEPTP